MINRLMKQTQEIKYRFALDSKGNMVDIRDITKENKREYAPFHGIGCNHEMTPVLGKIKQPHFRHKIKTEDAETCRESYIHMVCKKAVKDYFDSHNTFDIHYIGLCCCDVFESCKIKDLFRGVGCNGAYQKTENLKEKYDTCEEEKTYDDFKADLLLTNSTNPEIEPIYIEIYYTHKCSEEKIKSGNKIVEFQVFSEDDIYELLKNIKDNRTIEDSSATIRFYNFDKPIRSEHYLDLYFIIKDSNDLLRHNLLPNGISCQEVGRQHVNNSIYEIAIPHVVNSPHYGYMMALRANVIRSLRREKPVDSVEIWRYLCEHPILEWKP